MPDEITYFDVAAFLADIEPDYERYLDPIEMKQRLVLAVREKWPSMTAPGREGSQSWRRLALRLHPSAVLAWPEYFRLAPQRGGYHANFSGLHGQNQ